MRIMFVGVGALGSYFGGALAEAGHDVTLLIRNKAHRDAIRANGMQPDLPEETEVEIERWRGWFDRIGPAIVEPGNPVGTAKTLSP